MSDFNVIETQEQLNEVISDRLARKEAAIRKEYEGYISPDAYEEEKKKYGEYEATIEGLNSTISDLQGKVEGMAELQKQVDAYKVDSFRINAAVKHGIPFEMRDRIKGDNEEDIMKDAETLAPMFRQAPPSKKTDPVPVGKQKSATEKSLLEMTRRLRGE